MENVNNSTDATTIPPALKNRLDKNILVGRVINWVSIIIILVALLCVVIAFVKIAKFNVNSLESLFKINDIQKQAHSLITAFCVLCIISIILGLVGMFYTQIGCGIWLKNNNFDISQNIKTAKKQVRSSSSPFERDYKNLYTASYIASNPIGKFLCGAFIAMLALFLIFGFLSVIRIDLILNADELLRAKLTGEKFSSPIMDDDNWLLFLVVAPIFIIVAMVFLIKRKKWLKSL